MGSMKWGLDALIGFGGFAMLVTSMLGMFVIVPDLVTSGRDAWALRLMCSLALSATFFVVYLAAYVITKGRCMVLVIGSTTGVVAISVVLFVPIASFELLIALWVVAAMGLGSLSALWFCFVSSLDHRRILLFVSTGVGAGILGCLIESYFVDGAARMAIVLVGVCSLMGIIFLMRTRPEAALPPVIGNRESDKRSKILWTSALMLSISNFEFGFVLGVATDSQTRALCLGIAAAVTLVLAIDFSRRSLVTERSMSPFTPPVTVLAFVSMFLFDETMRVIALCMLSVLFTIYNVFGLAAMAEHVRISRLSFLRTFGKARFFDYLGVSLGLLCGFGIGGIAHENSLLAVQISSGIAIAYSFIAAFCHKARFPEAGMESIGYATLPGTKGLWKKRCRVVSERCGLSERQHDVLMLVAQGRNAKYIEQALTISLSTAQTHIRNIYRKTGVHSRQELLNLIENTKLYGEE